MTQSQAFGRLAAMAAREIQTSEEARLTDDYHIVGYNDFTDWPSADSTTRSCAGYWASTT